MIGSLERRLLLLMRTAILLISMQGPRRGRACPTMPGSEHGTTLVYAIIDDEVVVVFGEEMFGLQMHPSFLRSRADFVTILNEASILTLCQ